MTRLTETGNPDSYYLDKTKNIELTGESGIIETDISYFLGLTNA
mgnify:FL=1